MHPLETPAQLRHQRRTALLGAVLVTPFAFVDAAQQGSGAVIAVALSARFAWVASLVVGAALLSGDRPRPRTAAWVMSTGTVAAALVLVAAQGGTHSGYFGFLLSLPFCMAVLLPGHVPVASVAAAFGVAGGAFMLARDGGTTLDVVRYAGTGLGAAALALYGTQLGGRLLRRELESANARAEAAALLATSERRRAASERLALIGRLAAGVAHEIKNPLAFVTGNVDYVRGQLSGPRAPNGPEVDAALADVELGLERIRRIVADLRGFAREDADEPCGAAPDEAVSEGLRLASLRTRGTAIRTEFACGPVRVRICRKRLVQVIVNLVVNAADAVEAAPDERRWIEVSAQAAGPDVVIRVEDGGPGIPEAVLPRLFEPFFTTKPPGAGTGLGLALSREYVVAVGGRLVASNGERGGAVFELTLPPQSTGRGCDACDRVVDLPAPAPEPERPPAAPRAAAG